jgi:hypothetical protein
MPDERQGNPEAQPLPGSASDQNGEEQPGQSGENETRRRPGSPDGGDDSTGGESSEGSQSTGDPGAAG